MESRRVNWRKAAILGSLALQATTWAMYIGDTVDFRSNYAIPVVDNLRGIETSPGFSSSKGTELYSFVNEEGKRELYLEVDGRQIPINEKGYAFPPGITEFLGEILEQTSTLFREDIELGVRQYSGKVRQLLEEIIG